MKKLLALVAMMAIASPVFAEFNPYSPEQTDIDVTMDVQAIGEISWKNQPGSVNVQIADFGPNEGNAQTEILRVVSNVEVAVDCNIKPTSDDIPQYSELWVSAAGNTKKFIRSTTSPSIENGADPLFIRGASAIGSTIGSLSNEVPVTFEAFAWHGVVAEGAYLVTLEWTVGPTS